MLRCNHLIESCPHAMGRVGLWTASYPIVGAQGCEPPCDVSWTTNSGDASMATDIAFVVDVEIGPLERQLGVVYISDVLFDEPVSLVSGGHVTLKDVDGTLYDGVIEAVEDGKFCNRYRVMFAPRP